MSVISRLVDGIAGRMYACVNSHHALRVSLTPDDLEDPGTASRYRYLQGLLGSTGLGSGTTNMNVDGSSTAQEFYIEAHDDYDTLITGVGLLINDTATDHNSYGAVSSLTNGVDLVISELGVETNILDSAKTGGEVMFQMGAAHLFGDGSLLNEITNWKSNNDATLVYFDAQRHVPGGLRLGRGTTDRLTFRVNDNLTGLVDHECRIYGYKHYP